MSASPRPPSRPAPRPVTPQVPAADPFTLAPRRHVGFHSSLTELAHLIASMVVLSFAFAFVAARSVPTPTPPGAAQDPLAGQFFLPTAAQQAAAFEILPFVMLLVVLGFLLHEMAHKVVAQRMALWAEFRASLGGLGLALFSGLMTPFLLAAPGAVVIIGNATRRDAAYISIAGPMVNLLIGFAFLAMPSGPNPCEVGPIGNCFEFAAMVNGVLAVFNLVPVRPLDGSRILAWSVPVYVGMLAGAVALLALSLGALG